MSNSADNACNPSGDLDRIESALKAYSEVAGFEVKSHSRILPAGIFDLTSLIIDFNFNTDPQYSLFLCIFIRYDKDDFSSRCKLILGENAKGDGVENSEIMKVGSKVAAANGAYYPGNLPEVVETLVEDYFIWRKLNSDLIKWMELPYKTQRMTNSPPALTVATLVNTIESTTERLNRTYGTSNGQMIDDEVIERMSVEAEIGYDIASLCQKCKEKEQGNGN